MSKPTGLAAFIRKEMTSIQPINPEQPMSHLSSPRPHLVGKGDTAPLTIRLSRSDWAQIHQLAVSEGVSIQSLAIDGLSEFFVEQGLPALTV